MIKQSKQDRTYSRTAEDLERKYNLGQIAQGSNSKEVKELKSDIDNLSYRVKDLEESGGGGGSGKDGVSVLSVKQTTTSTEDGGTNVITCTLSDGTKSNFNIMNGNKGSDGTDGKSAYQYAQEGGYEGTESEFSEKMAEDVDVDIDYSKIEFNTEEIVVEPSENPSSLDIDYSKIEFDTEEIVVEPSTNPSSLDILDTMTEIEANTENGKIAGALAVKELSESLGGLFKFSSASLPITIGANSYKISNVIVPVDDNYVAIAIKGWNVAGRAEANCFAVSLRTDGSVEVNVWNPTSTQMDIVIHVYLLLAKKELVNL